MVAVVEGGRRRCGQDGAIGRGRGVVPADWFLCSGKIYANGATLGRIGGGGYAVPSLHADGQWVLWPVYHVV